MNKRITILFLAVFALAAPVFAQCGTYTTIFPATENPISQGGKWQVPGSTASQWGNVETTANTLAFGVSQPTTYGDATAVYIGNTCNANQSATAVVKVVTPSSTSGREVSLRLRFTISSSNIKGYELLCPTQTGATYGLQVVRWNGPNAQFMVIGGSSAHQCVTGDTLTGSITGTNPANITFSVSGPGGNVTVNACDDGGGNGHMACGFTYTNEGQAGGAAGPWTSGQPGMGFCCSTSTMNQYGFSSWSGSDATYLPATCQQGDVNAAINNTTPFTTGSVQHLAVNGDTIVIPAGNCTWTTSGINVTVGINIFGTGTPTPDPTHFGADPSCSATVLTANNSSMFTFVPTNSIVPLSRLSCMAINYSGPVNGPLSIAVSALGQCSTTTCTNLRVDNVTFNNWTGHGSLHGISYGINVSGDMFGVWDHNTVNGDGTTYLHFIELNHPRYPCPPATCPNGNGLYGDTSWAMPENFGSANFTFVENNLFNQAGVTENEGSFGPGLPFLGAQGGGRVVARFNTFNLTDQFNTAISWHGTESSGRPRSGREFEFYGNQITYPASCTPSGNCAPTVAVRGGTGLGWGNTINSATVNTFGFGLNFLRVFAAINYPACDGTAPEDGVDPSASASSPAFTGTLTNYVGATYTAGSGVATTRRNGSGSGLTVNTTVDGSGHVTSATIASGGTGYGNQVVSTINGGDGTAAVMVTSVGTGGVVTGIVLAFWNTVMFTGTPGWGANIWSPLGAPYSLHDVTWSTTQNFPSPTGVGTEISGNNSNSVFISSSQSFLLSPLAGDSVQITRAFWCMDQGAGRGKGSPPLNSNQASPSTPPFPASNEVVSPAYFWMNQFTNKLPGHTLYGSDTLRVIANRDMYFETVNQGAQTSTTLPFNGATGVGHGTFAFRPTAGTANPWGTGTGTAYWANNCPGASGCPGTPWNTSTNTFPDGSSQGQLYLWNGSTWVLSYTPFVYPHPFVTGGIVPGVVSVSPLSESFGSVVVGASSGTQTATLNNATTSSITITSVTTTGNTSDFPNNSNSCSGTIAANGGTCAVVTHFSPTSTGARAANIAIVTSAGTFNVALSGTGTSAVNPGVSISPASIAFGNVSVGTSTPGTTVTATSTTSANLVMQNPPVTISGAGFSLQAIGGQCTANQSIPMNSTCVESVVFTPAAPGAVSGSLSFFDNVTGSPQVVPLTGTGVGTIAVNPVSLNFGTIAQGQTSPAQPVVITNNTGITLTLTGTTFTNLDFAPTSNTCNSGTLTNGQSCTATITFRPSATTGTNETGFLLVNFTGVGGSPVSVPLAGTVLPPIGTPATNIFATNLAGCWPTKVTTFCFTADGHIYVEICPGGMTPCGAFKPMAFTVTGTAQ